MEEMSMNDVNANPAGVYDEEVKLNAKEKKN